MLSIHVYTKDMLPNAGLQHGSENTNQKRVRTPDG
jgi:hypothetical protein